MNAATCQAVTASPTREASQQMLEERVLRLLIAGQTYAEMALALVVSPNTIKTQVSSIYLYSSQQPLAEHTGQPHKVDAEAIALVLVEFFTA